MADELKEVCRVCLSNEKRKYVSLFEKYKDFFIFDHINSLANVQIKQYDGYPDKICKSCLSDLETAVNFRQKCESSNIVLLSTSITQTWVDVAVDLKEVVVKKEEPEPDIDAHFSDYSNFYTEELPLEHDEEKPKKFAVKNEDLGLRKSRAVDLRLHCDDCGEIFKSKCKLRVHWKRAHLLQNLICNQCKRRFKSAEAYQRHQKNKKQNCLAAKNFRIEGEGKARKFFCKECDYKSIRMKDMITHWVIHTGDRPFQCDLCPKTCTQQSSLTAHKESAHGEYKVEVTCQYCGKLVKGRNKIYRHLKLHTDESIQCQICQKTLKNRNCLKQHMQRHSGQKSYTCEKCANSFYTIAELSNHKRVVHSKSKRWYQCERCDYKAVRSDSMKKHKARHTDSNIPCTVCGMFFESAQKLVLHQRRHFEDKKHECPYCELKFFRKDTVPKHIKSKHQAVLQNNHKNVGFIVKEEKLHVENYVIPDIKPQSLSPIKINDDDL